MPEINVYDMARVLQWLISNGGDRPEIRTLEFISVIRDVNKVLSGRVTVEEIFCGHPSFQGPALGSK